VKLTLVGVNHQTAGIETRECLAVPADALPERLAEAVAHAEVAEALMLSTCNRSELYLVAANGCEVAHPEAVFARAHGVSLEEFQGHSYVLHGAAAVAHIFKVAAGADSMVLGETEIMGQLRQAIERAREAGAAGRVLSRMGDRALAVGKRVRTETKIDKGCMSVASVAADLARQIFDDLSTRRLLVLGAGEMGALVARRMMDNGARKVVIISRTRERAEALARDIGGEATSFEEFVDELLLADIVITSTSSPHPLVTVERVRAAAAGGRQRPMLIIDLAVPRDVEAQVRDINNVYLYDLDGLQEFVRTIEDQRLCELPQVETIAEAEANEFMIWAKSQEVVPLLLSIRQQAEAIREEEIAGLLETVPDLPRKADKALHLMSKRLVRRLLEQPLDQIRALAAEDDSPLEPDLVRRLFGLGPASPQGEPEAAAEGGEGPV
jgi:glutamyl-tRNA reductase